QALGLDDSYRFVSDRVHGLIVNLGKNQEATQDILQDLLRRFMTWPLCNKWFLRGIGEGSRSGFAYVFEDSRGALLAVRNEDALLGTSLSHSPTVENNALKTENAMDTAVDMAGLFSRTDGSPEREFPLAAFDALFTEGMGMNAEDLRVALTSAATVWTWTRLREKAEQAGHSAESAARALGLTGGTSIE
ncbi:MAG: hypothetical protein FWG59_05565, partial [Betaproteobacteria bacterium]|nr:hypothetical protein [Betaproteobacteria bacterium]